MTWEWPQADQLVLSWSLPAGSYATAVLDEVLVTVEPSRHGDGESVAP